MSSSALCFYLAVFISLITITNGQICMWGTTSNNNGLVNGEYIPSTNVNGQPSYVKSTNACGVTDLYLYYLDSGAVNRWSVSNQTTGVLYYTQCDRVNYDTFDTNVSSCDSYWVGGANSANGLYAFSGSCPAWTCARVDVTYPSGNSQCNMEFDTKEADNVYSGYNDAQGKTMYFYFNKIYFRWFCADNIVEDCSVSFADQASADGFTDLAVDNSLQIAMSSQTITVDCLRSVVPTPEPTTASPTTGAPSATPTTAAPTTAAPTTLTPTTGAPTTASPTTGAPTIAPTSGTPSVSPTTAVPTAPFICVWSSTINSKVNGRYIQASDVNGQPSFVKSMNACGASDLYLYYQNTNGAGNHYWNIYNSTNENLRGFARCATANLDTFDTNPAACDGNWVISSGTTAQTTVCPAWACDRVRLNYPSAPTTHTCDIEFDVKVADNVYSNAQGTVFFYFNSLMYTWYCKDNYDETCTNSYYDKAVQGFSELAVGSSVDMVMSLPETQSVTIDCLGAITPSPVTAAPTTVNQTPQPSQPPTTGAPTTANPTTRMPTTVNQTYSPTMAPVTASPNTAAPGTAPVNAPANNPAANPTAPPTPSAAGDQRVSWLAFFVAIKAALFFIL